uniref:Uncharacterized protein n=1 Tax=Rhizophora mucronata TaxID=61149 RepID=A0A2P2NEV7_RHIMU
MPYGTTIHVIQNKNS